MTGKNNGEDSGMQGGLACRAASMIGFPVACSARCARLGRCAFAGTEEGGPPCIQLMTAEEKQLHDRIMATGRYYLVPGGHLILERELRQAVAGGDEAPLNAAAAFRPCLPPGKAVDIMIARLRREVRATKAAARAAQRTGRRKARRARGARGARGALATGGDTASPPAPPPDLPAHGPEIRDVRSVAAPPPLLTENGAALALPGSHPRTGEACTGEARAASGIEASGLPETTAALPETRPGAGQQPMLRIRPLDRPPLVP